MKILFIVPYVPNLIRVRPYNLIRHLAEQGHKVTLATLWSSEQERADLKEIEAFCAEVIAFPLPRWRSWLNSLRALPGAAPLQSAYCWSPQLANELARRIRQGKWSPNPVFDVIHVEHLRGVRFGLELQRVMADTRVTPVVWDSVDSISYLFRQAARHNPRWWMRALFRLELHRTERYEREMLKRFPRVLVTSSVDCQAFIDLDPTGADHNRLTVLPNGVDLSYFHPGSEQRESATVVVSGKMSYHANINMALRLVREIMPLVWQEQPGVNVWIVGKDPPQVIQELAQDDRVTVTGTVPDLRPYLQKATVAIAPLFYGAGIQNKVLEAMACATPVIASSQSIAALQSLRPGEDVLTADDNAGFARQIISLLGNRELQTRLSQAGREYVEQNHYWGLITNRLEEIYRQTIFG